LITPDESREFWPQDLVIALTLSKERCRILKVNRAKNRGYFCKTFIESLATLAISTLNSLDCGNELSAHCTIARPAMNIRLNYYQIFGSTATELRSQMNQYGPPDPKTGRRFDAYTRWNVRWRYRHGRHRY